MSRVADGATTRRERLMDMLTYIRSFSPQGLSLTKVQLHMSLAHGLTPKKSQEYVYEMQLAGILKFMGGKIILDVQQFERLMELLGRDFDPSAYEV